MKKIIFSSLALLIFTLFSVAQGEPVWVDCKTSPEFEKNICEACYSDTFDAEENSTGWTSIITNIKIPWKHAEGNQDEIIYNVEQKYPEIRSKMSFAVKPTKPEDLWETHETLIWIPMVDHQEYVLKKGEEVGVYKLAQNASITIQGTKPDEPFMLFFPLVVRDFDAKTNQDSQPKTRNVCIEGKFTITKMVSQNQGTTTGAMTGDNATSTEVGNNQTVSDSSVSSNTPTGTNIPGTSPETETSGAVGNGQENTIEETNGDTILPLNSAEEEETITEEQTTTQTGPALWIILVLAFAFSSGLHAWRKQKA